MQMSGWGTIIEMLGINPAYWDAYVCERKVNASTAVGLVQEVDGRLSIRAPQI